jgi:hypothetical protein
VAFHASDPDDSSGFTFSCQLDSQPATACTSPQTYPNLADGNHHFQVTASDPYGNTSQPALADWKTDRIPPLFGPTVTSGTAGNNGWYRSDVTVAWNWSDPDGSGIDSTNCTRSSTSSSEGHLTLTAPCTDLAGNSNTAGYTVNVDKTAPTISAAAISQPNANGWYNANVTVHFTCTDTVSGVASCPPDQVLSSEGLAVSSTAQSATDVAGNTSAKSNVVTVAIDKAAPVVSVTGVTNGAAYTLGNVPTPACSTTDALSGVATPASLQITCGTSNGVGSFTATCSGALDKAGNAAPAASATYTVNYAFSGFLAPVNAPPTVNTGKAGKTYPVKFQLTSTGGSCV